MNFVRAACFIAVYILLMICLTGVLVLGWSHSYL